MEDYASNSHKSKEQVSKSPAEEKKVEKVVSGKAKTKKKSEIQKFSDIFISEDAANVKDYIFGDVLVPAIKKAISDIVTNGIDMILYGETGHTKKSPGSKISYTKYYDRRDDRGSARVATRSAFDYDDIILTSRVEAEDVLRSMDEIIDTYEMVSIADMYELAGLDCPYTYANYGWTDIRNARVVGTRDGYLLKMPRAVSLK